MNMHRLPAKGPDLVPAAAGTGREVDFPYRGGAAPEFESRESPLRATLLKFLGLAIKYRLLIAIFCATMLALGLIVTFFTPRIYSAATVVKIDRAAPKVIKDQSTQFEANGDPQFYQTQYELIKSRSLAESVATRLNLAQTDFVGGSQSFWSRFRGRTAAAQETITDPAVIAARREQAIGKIVGGLQVQPVQMSSLVRIRFADNNPVWAQRISIALAEGYERSTLDRRFTASGYARNFLEERLQQLKLKLQDSEQQLIAYAQKQGIVNVDEKQPQGVATLQGVQQALATAVSDRVKAEQLWQQAQQPEMGLALPQIMEDKLIQSARERIAALQATYQDKLNTLKPAFPEMLALRAQISEGERQIRNQMALIKESIKARYEAARAQEIALVQQLEEVKTEVLDQRGRSVEYTILLREVDTARSLYEGILQQFRELGVASEVDTNNISIIDRAQLPGSPDSPSLRINLLISLFLGLLGSAGVIAVREALDDTFKSAEDIEEGLGLSVLGVTPFYVDDGGDSSPVKEVINDKTSPLAEAYRSLRTALQFSTEDGAPKTLLVTSSQPGEGKSTTSVSLAINFAQLGSRVLLIDGDLRNPSLHRVLEADNSAGLSNYLAGATEVSTLVQSCLVDGVTFMSTGPLPPNPAELLAGPRFANLLSVAAEAFDIVIIDGPPVMGLADAPIIAASAAGTLLVVETARTRRAIVRDAVKRLDFARARMVGVLLNKFDARRAGYTYGYGYGYGYAYGGSNYYSYGRDPKTGAAKPAALTEN